MAPIHADSMAKPRRIADIKPVVWRSGRVAWIDQRKLPWREQWVESSSVPRLAEAIRGLEIRGAPAIGVAAAMGIAMAAAKAPNEVSAIMRSAGTAGAALGKTRPTAVNLFWAISRMADRAASLRRSGATPRRLKSGLIDEALKIQRQDIEANMRMGRFGDSLIRDGDVILTHCNAGALATAGFGTSYGVIRTAWRSGKDIKVIATHTAPLYQGARLTMWELTRDGIPATLITDNMAAYAMENAGVTKVLLGADRILMNGDVANKIGTYGLAVLAKYHNIPFYVAAPISTIDPRGKSIPIEQRNPEEVRNILGKLQITVPGVPTLNPAFDVTPHRLVSAIITERGIATEPFPAALQKLTHGLLI